ncbi:hypothetical protein HAX54_003876 [Datura stramonium]|uniref:UBC core domain-containing protein n=1 Tax=Datura stramonium TaxID=4076 RepID=A0ABS8T6U8_DATST|nr:hypothetical protein [Datura stramonium]
MDVGIVELSSQEDSEKLKNNKEAMTKDNSHTVAGSTSVSLDSGNNNSSNSDLSFHEDQNVADDGMDDCDDVSNYDDDDDYMYYDNDDDDECDYLSMQAQFDNVDLPAGVEATVSWLNEPSPSSKATSQVSSSSHLAGAQTSKPTLPEHASCSFAQVSASSSSLVSAGSNSRGKEEETEDELMKKYQNFKHFDVVEDFSDHHYSNLGFQGQQPPKAWSKKVQDEWKILENDLPDTIYVRVYESRMDLLRAVIIGPQGTPYHDGLFVFDVLFPQNYPDVPPHFEDLVIGHFRCHAVDVLSACKAYLEGATVGSVVKGIVQGASATEDRSSTIFRESVSRMMNGLISLFTKHGAKDCDRFRA